MDATVGVVLLWALLGIAPVSITTPPYPPQAVSGGTVVAELQLLAGSPQKVKILSGQEPFVSSTRSALARWRFAETSPGARVLVVVCYRGPNMFAMGTTAQEVDPGDRDKLLPYPTAVNEPAYPPNSPGEGSVVLDLEIGADGSISDVQTVKGAGSQADASIAAVRSWKFAAAHDEQGNAISSDALAVFVFRPPVLAPGPVRR